MSEIMEKMKKLEAEKDRLLEEARLTREGLQTTEKQNKELIAKTGDWRKMAETQRLAIKELEAKHQAAEDEKRHLEEEKKALASELARKAAEEARLGTSLHEAGGTWEKMNAQIIELKGDLQNTNKHFKVLQSEKERLEGEKQAALKSAAEKAASLAALGEIRERFEGEKKRLEAEKRSFGEELEARAAEEARLLEKIQGFETKCAQTEAALKANGEVLAQEAEKQRLAIKELEAKHQAAEEVRRNLEEEKKALASELAGKAAEEARLKKSLQEAGGTSEKLNAQIIELKEELQNTNKHFEELQSEKKSLEEERRHLEKAMSDRFAQTDAQLERLTQQSAEYDDVVNQIKNERDKKGSMVEDLTVTAKKMEVLLKERETEQASLEKELKEEKEKRVKAQDHAKYVEEVFLALEKKINAML